MNRKDYATASRMRADVARSKYENGLTSFVDWDYIENEHIRNQKSLLTSYRDAMNAQAQWLSAQGKGDLP